MIALPLWALVGALASLAVVGLCVCDRLQEIATELRRAREERVNDRDRDRWTA